MRLSILGAGAWGTALAVSVGRRHPTLLWTRDPAHAAELDRDRSNRRYLPGVALPAALQTTGDFDAAVAHAADGLVLIATPMSGLAPTLSRLSRSTARILWLCKGFEHGTAALGHEVAAAIFRSTEGPSTREGVRVGVLSGPSFAIEVARGQPTALVVASHDAALRADAVAALHGDGLRIYTSDDPVGVEVGGAVKNVFAIASGIADGMPGPVGGGMPGPMGVDMPGPVGLSGLGLNARAALVTRGLAEMTRLGVALGARAETFMGLSGVGDLVLTTTGDLSRNRRVGLLLAQGWPLPRILEELGHVAEGVSTAPMVLRRARSVGVEMPIVEAVADVIDGRTTPARALEGLMGRGARTER